MKEQRKVVFRRLREQLKEHAYSEYHYQLGVKTLLMMYRSVAYKERYRLSASQIAERLGVKQFRIHDLFRKFESGQKMN